MKHTGKRTKHSYTIWVGIILLTLGIAGLRYSTYPLETQTATGGWIGGQGVILEAEIPKKIRLSDDGTIHVKYSFWWDGQLGPDYYEEVTITLQASSIETAPASGEAVKQRVTEFINGDWIWTITPQKLGQQQVILQFSRMWGPLLAELATDLGVDNLSANAPIMSTKSLTDEQLLQLYEDPQHSFSLVIPITVVDVFGLNAIAAKILSGAVAFLGGGFTLTWLYEQRQKRRTADEPGIATQKKLQSNHPISGKLCPKCRKPMEKQMSTKGENKGKLYYVCPNVQECQQIFPIE